MSSRLSLCLTLFCLFILSCQKKVPQLTPDQLNQWCATLSYNELTTGLAQLKKEDTTHQYSYGALQERDIIEKYSECLFVINKKARTDTSKEDRYLLELITKDSSIVSYKIYNSIYSRSDLGLPWKTNDLLYFEKNTVEIDKLKHDFQSTFKTALNFNELFRTDLFFG